MLDFDDSRLQDREALAAADALLRPLAEAGARIRREDVAAQAPLAALSGADRPRAVPGGAGPPGRSADPQGGSDQRTTLWV